MATATTTDYTPSIKDDISNVYRRWFVVLAIFSILTGIALIAMGITMKVLNDDLSSSVCHIWNGIPLLVGGFVAILPVAAKPLNLHPRKFALFYLGFMFICMVVCAAVAIVSGIEYWTMYWGQTKLSLDNHECRVKNGVCMCTTLTGLQQTWLPASTENCDDLDSLVGLMIATIAIDLFAFILCLTAVLVSFMSVCCERWVFIGSSYKE